MEKQQAQDAMDVFAASEWLGELWNSSARAVSREVIEWQCDAVAAAATTGWTTPSSRSCPRR